MKLSNKALGIACLFMTIALSSPSFAADLSVDNQIIDQAPVVSMKDAPEAMPQMDLPNGWFVTVNPEYGERIMDQNKYITSKTIDGLLARKNGQVKTGGAYISGLFKGSWLYEKTDTEDSFPILTRFPTHTGTTANRFFVDNAAIALTVTPTDWLTAFAQLEYHEIRFDSQDEVQLRKAYVVAGDLNRSPFYAAFGRKTINFGDFSVYSPFTHNINNHFFRAEADSPIFEVGFVNDWLHLTATAISGGRHIRTADTADDDEVNNFAVDADVFIPLWHGHQLRVGGGYLHGTIYNSVFPHHPGTSRKCDATGWPIDDDGNRLSPGAAGNVPECRGRNAAWDIRAEYTSPMFDLMAEYTQTVDPWEATGAEIKAWTVQGRYKTALYGYDTHFTAAYSKSKIGTFRAGSGAQFDELDQIVGGIEVFLTPNFTVSAEYSRNKGFAPLADVTGNANEDVEADQVVLGVNFTF